MIDISRKDIAAAHDKIAGHIRRTPVVEINIEQRNDPARARELLSMIVENFEGTRHAANAQHKIEEIHH